MIIFLGASEETKNLEDLAKKYHSKVFFAKDSNEVSQHLSTVSQQKVLLLDDKALPHLQENLDAKKLPHMNSSWELVILFDENPAFEVLQEIPDDLDVWHLISGTSSRWQDTTQAIYECAYTENEEEQGCRAQNIIKVLENKQSFELTHSDERMKHQSQIVDYVRDLNAFPLFEQIIETSADELLSNAFYNAPRNPKTKEPLVTQRTIPIQLPADKNVKLIYGTLNGYFWLFVIDSYGTLTNQNFSKALIRALSERKPKMENSGGAGIGLLMLYDWASQIMVQVRPGVGTRIGCQFLITRRNKIFNREQASIHFQTRR